MLTYVAGLGWIPSGPSDQPTIVGDSVYFDKALLDYFGFTLPRLSDIRSSSGGTVRLVLDISGLAADSGLQELQGKGRLQDGGVLTLKLPKLLLPLSLPDLPQGLELNLSDQGGRSVLELSGPGMVYHVFSLTHPTRLVIDVTPFHTANVKPQTKTLAPGVVYKVFSAPTEVGESAVHMLEIAPGSGQFKVVASPDDPEKVSDLAGGAFAAINAGYFNTKTFQAIGLLVIDHTLLSLPFLHRASIGFGLGAPLISRVSVRFSVTLGGQSYQSRGADGDGSILALGHTAGDSIGAPTQGVIVAQNGQVISNTIGPKAVPPGGFAFAYTPDSRALALVNSGAPVSFELHFSPPGFGEASYAVEAGPLLIKDGYPAYDPKSESFATGTRVVDGYTQQAAIGVKADGTVILLTADNMDARDLIPLFLSLGATDAMRLDSGSSATLYAAGKVLNRHFERHVVSAIVFMTASQNALGQK
jgi:hypothetical protein